MQLAIWAEIVRARARAGPRARPRADQEWLELEVWRFVACRETRYGGSVWSWKLKFGVSRVQLRALTMNLLVHLVCSYYGTRPRRVHACACVTPPKSRSAHRGVAYWVRASPSLSRPRARARGRWAQPSQSRTFSLQMWTPARMILLVSALSTRSQ